MNTQASWRYWPALDGVRALAVAAVMVFQAAPEWLPGGFLGVDAFFVLSGFLITGLLLSEAQRGGTIRVGAFWGRRVRRLLPALLLLLVTVAVGARFLGPAQWLPGLRWDTVAALAFVPNWWTMHHGATYFAHLWSLGIEGQFYLLWPLLVLLALKRRLSRTALFALCLTGAGASALLCAVLYRAPTDTARVYYSTGTRGGALLVGCAVAVLLSGRVVRPNRWLTAAAGCAGALLVAFLVLPRDDTPWLYRGGLIAIALSVAVVVMHLVTSPGSYPTLLLSLPPVVWVGRISYGLYLWHLPVYLVLSDVRTGLSGIALFGLRIAVTVLIATASFYLVELPIRRGWTLRLLPVAAAAATAAVAVTVMVVLPGTAPGSVVVGAAQEHPNGPVGPPPITRTDRAAGPPRIAVFGDSVAWTLGEYLLPVAGDLSITSRGVQDCGIARLPDVRYQDSAHTADANCEQWDEQWRTAVGTDDPDVAVILLDRWELMDRNINGRYLHVGEPDYDAYVTGELKLAISIASVRGARVVLLTAPYTRADERPDGSLYDEDSPERVDAWNQLLGREAATNPAHPTVLDLNRVVCPGGSFTPSVGDVRVRNDGLTFTAEGVQQLIAPWLLPRLRQLATT